LLNKKELVNGYMKHYCTRVRRRYSWAGLLSLGWLLGSQWSYSLRTLCGSV